MPLDQIFLQEFNLLITLPFLVSTLGSIAANEVKEFAKGLKGRKAAKQATLAEKIREYKEQNDWPKLLQEAWNKALCSNKIPDNEFAVALSDEVFINKLFADLLSQEATNELLENILAERNNIVALSKFNEHELREFVPAILKAFIVAISKDELLRFLYVAAQNQKIFDRLIQEGAITREQHSAITHNLQLSNTELDSFRSEHSAHARQTADTLFEILTRLKNPPGQHPVMLIDDVIYEMDETRRNHFFEEIGRGGQVLITATEIGHLGDLAEKAKLFRVESGSIGS